MPPLGWILLPTEWGNGVSIPVDPPGAPQSSPHHGLFRPFGLDFWLFSN